MKVWMTMYLSQQSPTILRQIQAFHTETTQVSFQTLCTCDSLAGKNRPFAESCEGALPALLHVARLAEAL